MESNKWQNRIEEHAAAAESTGHEVLGVFLYGSQNYGLETDESDVDSKAIIIPKLDDIVLNKKPVSTKLTMDNGEFVELKDIRLMFNCYRKQNVNFVETLFTDYYVMNDKYLDLFSNMLCEDAVAYYNPVAAVNCIIGMAFEKRKALTHPYPATMDKIEKYGYDPKQLHHILRLEELLDKYMMHIPYRECIHSAQREYLVDVKSGKYTLDRAIDMADETVGRMVDKKMRFLNTDRFEISKDTEELMNNTLSQIIKRAFKYELLEDSNG